MPSVAELLEREAQTVDLERDHFERLARRRDRKKRNKRIAARVLAIIVAIVSFAALIGAFRNVERPANEPSPSPKPPGIFSEVGGWIAYGNRWGIWAMDPSHPRAPESRVRLSPIGGIPLEWSSEGSKLLILRTRRVPHQAFLAGNLFVLNADGTETRLTEGDAWIGRGSFSPDGSKVVYATDRGIVVVDIAGGGPQALLTGRGLVAPTVSPDGSRIAYFSWGESGAHLRVINADGSGSRVLSHDVFEETGHTLGLVWSPDGTRLAIDYGGDIYTIKSNGSDLTLVIPQGGNPNWSPDGSHIAYDFGDVPGPFLEIADADGKNVQEFANGRSGPWNPLVQPEPEVAEAPSASGGLTLTSMLLLAVLLLALVTGVVALIRRRRVHRS
jgi:hypothetical protein